MHKVKEQLPLFFSFFNSEGVHSFGKPTSFVFMRGSGWIILRVIEFIMKFFFQI